MTLAVGMMSLIIQFSHEILKCHQLQPDTQTSDRNTAVCQECLEHWRKGCEWCEFNTFTGERRLTRKMYQTVKDLACYRNVCWTFPFFFQMKTAWSSNNFITKIDHEKFRQHVISLGHNVNWFSLTKKRNFAPSKTTLGTTTSQVQSSRCTEPDKNANDMR